MLPPLLTEIQDGLRELVSHYSGDSLTNDEANRFINKAYLKIPNQIMVRELDTFYRFSTTPNVYQYDLQKIPYTEFGDQWNTIDKFYKFGRPITIGGCGCGINFFTDKTKFYCHNCICANERRQTIKSDDNNEFSVTLRPPVLPNSLHIFMLGNEDCEGVKLQDRVVSRCNGSLHYENSCALHDGSINYISGKLTFKSNVSKNAEVVYVNYCTGKPESLLFYGTSFFLYPVPNKHYLITVTATKYPTTLFAESESPLLRDWADWIMYRAAKFVFVMRMNEKGILHCEQQMAIEKLELIEKKYEQINEGSKPLYNQCNMSIDGSIYG